MHFEMRAVLCATLLYSVRGQGSYEVEMQSSYSRRLKKESTGSFGSAGSAGVVPAPSPAPAGSTPTCTCKPGFIGGQLSNKSGQWKFDNCQGTACTCGNGTSTTEPNLSALLCSLTSPKTNCASCNPGFFLDTFKCNPWAGKCENGDLIEQVNRTQDNHCGSCKKGFELKSKSCHKIPEPAKFGNNFTLPRCDVGTGINASMQCESCSPGMYQKQANMPRFCIAQTARDCGDGEQIAHKDDRKRDTECVDCPSGKFTNKNKNVRTCTDHSLCDNTTQIIAQIATSTSDRVCADVVNCSVTGGQQRLFTKIENFLTGSNTWRCISTAFTGAITNPIYLSGVGNVTDATTGTFTIGTIVIGATGTAVAVAGGVTVVGLGAVAPAVAINSQIILQSSVGLAKQFAGTTAAQFQEALKSKYGAAINQETSLPQQAEKMREAIAEVVPNATKDQIAEGIRQGNPSLLTDAANEYSRLKNENQALVAEFKTLSQNSSLTSAQKEARKSFILDKANKNATEMTDLQNMFGTTKKGLSQGKFDEISNIITGVSSGYSASIFSGNQLNRNRFSRGPASGSRLRFNNVRSQKPKYRRVPTQLNF